MLNFNGNSLYQRYVCPTVTILLCYLRPFVSHQKWAHEPQAPRVTTHKGEKWKEKGRIFPDLSWLCRVCQPAAGTNGGSGLWVHVWTSKVPLANVNIGTKESRICHLAFYHHHDSHQQVLKQQAHAPPDTRARWTVSLTATLAIIVTSSVFIWLLSLIRHVLCSAAYFSNMTVASF